MKIIEPCLSLRATGEAISFPATEIASSLALLAMTPTRIFQAISHLFPSSSPVGEPMVGSPKEPLFTLPPPLRGAINLLF